MNKRSIAAADDNVINKNQKIESMRGWPTNEQRRVGPPLKNPLRRKKSCRWWNHAYGNCLSSLRGRWSWQKWWWRGSMNKWFHYRAKCFIVVDAFLLTEPFGNKASLMSLNRTVCTMLDSMPTDNDFMAREGDGGTRDHVFCEEQSCHSHSGLLVGLFFSVWNLEGL